MKAIRHIQIDDLTQRRQAGTRPWGPRLMVGLAMVASALPVLVVAQQPPPNPATVAVPLQKQPMQDILNLSAQASVEVARDVLVVAFSTMKEGADAQALQTQLKQALDAALAEAKRVAKPGQVDVETGAFSLSPRYTNNGKVSGWQGNAELIVKGKDMSTIAQLTGKVTTMTVARVHHELSREAKNKVDADVTARAIDHFRQQAAWMSKQFGYTGFVVREVHVSSSDPGVMHRPMAAQVRSASLAAESSLPTEAGNATIMASVSGSVTMTK